MAGSTSDEIDIEISTTLSHLIDQGLIYNFESFYSLSPQINKQVEERIVKENSALKSWDKISKYAQLMSRFPFVRGVGISGSISKNILAGDGDVDYFIITKKHRLWLCRSLLVLYKKVILLNSRKYFCVNYFIDEENLIIPDKNIFTALEIQTLIPVYNTDLFQQFNHENKWVNDYFGRYDHSDKPSFKHKKHPIKTLLEFLLSGALGESLDKYCMHLSFKRWMKKFGGFDKTKFDQTMRTSRRTSKHHPLDFQNKVLTEFESKMKKHSFQELTVLPNHKSA